MQNDVDGQPVGANHCCRSLQTAVCATRTHSTHARATSQAAATTLSALASNACVVAAPLRDAVPQPLHAFLQHVVPQAAAGDILWGGAAAVVSPAAKGGVSRLLWPRGGSARCRQVQHAGQVHGLCKERFNCPAGHPSTGVDDTSRTQ